jgi:hypothetical protein
MKLAKRLVGSMLVLVAVALNAAAFASPPQYLINIATLGEFYSSVPFRKDASNPLSVGNGTATFSGHAFAGPGWISSYARQDIQFSSGLSGGGGSTTRSRAQTDDFVISGPPGSVTGTLHFRVKAALAKGGGFDGNGAHQAHLDCTVSANFNNYSGSLAVGNGGISGTGTLAGWSSSTLDKAIDITASFPVGAPLLVYMVLDAVDFTYGNVFVNPGWVETDAGGNSDQYGGAGLKLVEVGGQVMTLPPGYTLNSTNFGVVDNHFTVTSAVNDTPRSPLSLSVFPNPFNPRTTVKYTVPSRGVVAIDVYDAAGAHVATLFHGEKNAGAYSVDWDGRATGEASVSSGVYFARISFNGSTETKKMVLLK